MSNQYDEPTQLYPNNQSPLCQDSRRVELPVAIIACHPDPNRLGEFASLDGLMQFKEQDINRHWPEFHPLGSSIGRGLGVPQVSRKAMRLEKIGKLDLILHRQHYSAPVMVNGESLDERVHITQAQLQQGVELWLGDHVMLLLCCMPSPGLVHDDLGLVGISDAMHKVRERVIKVAPAEEPVLIRGATGSGKELIAQALNRQSSRYGKPFIAVNIAALQPSLAVSELFGSVKGAFTGATDDRKGYFQAANGGTLFLDEIGEASQDVQAMLLRALENHEVVPVGATEATSVDVRIIAATDADLEQDGEGSFKQPLLHRLSSYQIFLPPLAQRREDIPGLLAWFMQNQWKKAHGDHKFPFNPATPVLTNALMSQLLRASWPGNVRQLRNVARQLLIDFEQGERLQLDPQLARMIEGQQDAPRAQSAPEPAPLNKRRPSQITREELAQVLRSHRYELQATAEELGISRASVYQLIDRHPSLRNTSDFSESELREAYEACDGDLEVMMEQLEVSQIGLRRRLRAIGLDQ
ncbi:MAG: sigma-54-dependent Fis family transcriptional regulator [Idiomarina sp.]|nr:sigma-54-dependent Fis family transcriptional regulator [Idiomarina sp.]